MKHKPQVLASTGPRANALWGVIDQAISSVTNFGSSITAALLLSSEQFGAFAVAYLVYSIVVPGIQAIVGQELVLATGDEGALVARTRDALLFALLLGSLAGLCLAAVSIFVPDVRNPLLVLAITLPALQLQDTVRYAASLMGRMQIAVLSDGAWLVIGAGALMAALELNLEMTPAAFVAVWAGSGAIASVVTLGAFKARHLPFPTLSRFRSREYLGYRFVWEYVALRGSSQAFYIALGGLAGLAATGGLRGATSLFGPLTVMILATSSFGVHILRSISPPRREGALIAVAMALVAVCIAATIAIRLIPDTAGANLLGDTWGEARAFSLAVGTQTALTSVAALLFVALRMVAPKSTLRIRVLPAALLPFAFFAGFYAAGASGAVWGITAAGAIQAAVALLAYLKLRREGRGLATI